MNLGIGLGVTNYLRVPTVALDPDAAIAALFESGEVGAWYDPSDSTTVFQDAAGTTPAGVGDPVGLILDKSQGLTLGPELVDTANDASAWTPYGTNIIEQDGDAVKISFSNDNKGGYVYLSEPYGLSITLPNDRFYKIQFEAKLNLGAANVTVANFAGGVSWPLTTEYQTFTTIGKRNTTPYLVFNSLSAGEVAYIRNISVKELPGNHATQTTSAARPVLQQSGDLYYLDFDGVDDSLRTALFASEQAQPNTLAVAHKFDAVAVMFVVDGVGTPRHAIYTFINELRFFANSAGTISGTVSTDPQIVVATFNSTNSSARLNAVETVSGVDVGSSTWSGITLGQTSTTTGSNLNGRIYSYVGVNRALTAGEIDDLETYLASKSGVTL